MDAVADHHSVADIGALGPSFASLPEWKALSASVHQSHLTRSSPFLNLSQCQATISKTNERCTHPPKENGYCGKHKYRATSGPTKRKHRRTKNVKIRTKPLTVLADIDPDFTLRSEKIAQEWRDLNPDEKSFWHEKASNEFSTYKHHIGSSYDSAQQMQLELHRQKKMKPDHKLPILDKQQLLNTLSNSLGILDRTKQALEENLMEARKLPDLPDQWTSADVDFLKNSYALAQSVADTRTTLLQAQPLLVSVSVPLVRPFMDHELPHPSQMQELNEDDLRHHHHHSDHLRHDLHRQLNHENDLRHHMHTHQ